MCLCAYAYIVYLLTYGIYCTFLHIQVYKHLLEYPLSLKCTQLGNLLKKNCLQNLYTMCGKLLTPCLYVCVCNNFAVKGEECSKLLQPTVHWQNFIVSNYKSSHSLAGEFSFAYLQTHTYTLPHRKRWKYTLMTFRINFCFSHIHCDSQRRAKGICIFHICTKT